MFDCWSLAPQWHLFSLAPAAAPGAPLANTSGRTRRTPNPKQPELLSQLYRNSFTFLVGGTLCLVVRLLESRSRLRTHIRRRSTTATYTIEDFRNRYTKTTAGLHFARNTWLSESRSTTSRTQPHHRLRVVRGAGVMDTMFCTMYVETLFLVVYITFVR